MEDIIKTTEDRMKKTIETLKRDFATVRTGRASPALLDRIVVEYYGTEVPLKQLASITVPDSSLLVVQPYDKSSTQAIEKAIQKSDLGLNPAADGSVIRLPIPKPTEERRKELVKMLKQQAESAKVAIRNIRRDAMDHLKAQKGKEGFSEDAEKLQEDKAQKLTDKYIKDIDEHLKGKEAEVMEV